MNYRINFVQSSSSDDAYKNIFLVVTFSVLKQNILKKVNKGRKRMLNMEQYQAMKKGALKVICSPEAPCPTALVESVVDAE